MGKKTTPPTPNPTPCCIIVPVCCVEYSDYAYCCINVLQTFFSSLDGVQKTKSLDDQQHQNKKLCLGHY